MQLGEPIDTRVPWARYVDDLRQARGVSSAGPKLDAMRTAGRRLGDDLRAGPQVVSVRTLPLTTLLYPTSFAFNHAVPLPWPFVQLYHRCLLVQVMAEGALKNILFNPSDYEANRATPYFAKLIARVGKRGAALLAKSEPQVDIQLAALGLAAEDIDVIAFDHFHTQDLRPILGDGRLAARFPNAHLIAPRQEWEDWGNLHPLQRAWFIAEGKDGVPADKVVLTDGDVSLGDGCLLLQTPGHTTGNQTLFTHAETGVFGCSENGTSADNWAPLESKIPGLRRFAELFEVEVILNSNTPELAAEQYTSMILEREMVDAVPGRPGLFQMFPSSEVTPSAFAPGVRPTTVFGKRTSGKVRIHQDRIKTSSQSQMRPAVA